ncbi:MAG TPA: flagellar basal body P-ring formation chaperone FlgA [Humisphaera sp.]
MYGNGRPLTKRQMVRVTIALTILAWATQVLFKQWGYGAEAPAVPATEPADAAAANAPVEVGPAVPTRGQAGDRFIAPRPNAQGVGATLQFQAEAVVTGPEVRLRQVGRWSSRDAAFFAPIADLVVARMDATGPYRTIDMDAVRRALADAGVNAALVKFVGPRACTVSRGDARPDSDVALAKWIDATEKKVEATGAAGVPAAAAAAPRGSVVRPLPAETGVRSLREALTDDLAVRLKLPPESLQVQFNPKDERALNLCEPQYKFNLEPVRVRNLGEVVWAVTVVSGGGQASAPGQKLTVTATARAWQQQVVVARPIPARSTIRDTDVVEKRALIDALAPELPLAVDQCVGQQSARDLRPGTVLTAPMIEAVQLAKQGQLITVTLNRGGVQVRTVCRALEAGAYGQRVRVRNEVTNDVYDVVLTGLQEAVLGQR